MVARVLVTALMTHRLKLQLQLAALGPVIAALACQEQILFQTSW
jgi:hypothetical protein